MSSTHADAPLGALLEQWASLDHDAEAATVRDRRTRCARRGALTRRARVCWAPQAMWSEDASAGRHNSPSGLSSECVPRASASPRRRCCCACAASAPSASARRRVLTPRARSGDLAALSALLPLPDAADAFADGFLDVDDVLTLCPPEAAEKNTSASPAASAEEEARRAARLARNREAAALSRARRRAAADGLEARCSKLEAENRELQRTVASLTSENHALRLHILATCPPPAPGSVAAPLAPLGVVPLPVLPPSALPLPLPKLPLPKLPLPARPAPAPARKAEPASKPEPAASKRKRTTFAAAAAALIALAVIGSPFAAPFDMNSHVPDVARPALPAMTLTQPSLHANTSLEALHLANALLESARVAALDLNASSTTPFLLLSPPSVPLASTEQESSGALVPLFPGTADAESTALLHTQWLEETWRPLISLPLSDERAKAALKALSLYAVATGGSQNGDLLGMRSPLSALQSTWPTAAPPALTCRRLFAFTPAVDFGTAAPSEAGASASNTVPRALRRFGGAWPLPPTASEAAAGPRAAADVAPGADSEVVVSLLQPPAGYTIGGTPTVGGSSASSVLVVVLIRGAQRYLTFSCAL